MMDAGIVAQQNGMRLWLLRLGLLLPAIAVAFAGVPRLISGLAQEAAFPFTAYLAVNAPLTEKNYAATAQILSHAPGSDGDAQLLRAEAAIRAGQKADAVPIAEAALSHAPADARGWIVLSEALSDSDPQKAAAALALAIELAPREYFLIVPRTRAGAPLWRYLPHEARLKLLQDTRVLISTDAFRRYLPSLLAAPGGPALVTRALAGHPDELRALNRSLARERLGLH